MIHKLGGRKSVIIFTLTVAFVLSFYLVAIAIKLNDARSKTKTASTHKTMLDSKTTRQRTEEPVLKVLDPTLPGTPNLSTNGQSDINAEVVEVETSITPILPPPDITNAIITNGMVPVFYSLKTAQPVVFLTIDDGIVKDPATTSFMAKHRLLASLFLNDSKITDDYGFFRSLQTAGNPIENHTVSHHDLTKLSYAQQKYEICSNADNFEKVFGKRPTLFRPPYGAFNNTTRRAAADCGMSALIHWHAKANGGSMQYQQGDKLQPGDIVLMHFRKEVIADLTAFTEAAQKANLRTVLLEDWIK